MAPDVPRLGGGMDIDRRTPILCSMLPDAQVGPGARTHVWGWAHIYTWQDPWIPRLSVWA